MSQEASTIYSVLLQLSLAIFTAALTLLGGMWLFRQRETIKNDQARRSLASALLEEISAAWSRYWEIAGKEVAATEQGSFWHGYIRPSEGLFTVYDHNTDKLGLFDPTEVSQIVDCYTHAKGFVSRLREWDRLLETYESAHVLNPISLSPDTLVHHFDLLRNDQQALQQKIDAVGKLLTRLRTA